MPTDRELIAELRARVDELAAEHELQPLQPVMEHVETGVLNVAPQAPARRVVAASETFSTPDITTGQGVSIGGTLAAVLAVVLTAPERLQQTLLLVIGAVAIAALISDAIIRHGRARGNADRLG